MQTFFVDEDLKHALRLDAIITGGHDSKSLGAQRRSQAAWGAIPALLCLVELAHVPTWPNDLDACATNPCSHALFCSSATAPVAEHAAPQVAVLPAVACVHSR